jgi:hypothetical protein
MNQSTRHTTDRDEAIHADRDAVSRFRNNLPSLSIIILVLLDIILIG